MIPIALTIAAATAVGFGAERRLGGERAQLAAARTMRLMLWVLIPPVAFFNLADLHLTAGVGAGLAFGWIGMLTAMAVAYVVGTHLLRLPRPVVGTLMLAAGMGNSGYLGVPFTAALFGFDDVGDAVIFDVIVSGVALPTLAFAVGAAFGTVATEARTRLIAFFTRNPALWAAAAGLLAPEALSPDWAVDASRFAVMAMLPMGFFVVGVTLASEAEEGAVRFPPRLTVPVGVAIGLKMILFPTVVLALSVIFIDIPDPFISQAAMACGINPLLVAHVYGMDRSLAASAVAYSTVIVVAVGLVVSFA
ncbi:MAG: hypothetical protein GXY03_06575 [Solirubrobacterales bacterium]|nr:hypothetical protein [Solirubrobacterales bacterium]